MWGAPGIQHPLFDGPRPVINLNPEPYEADSDLVKKIIGIYQSYPIEFKDSLISWAEIMPLKKALENEDEQELTDIFANLFQTDVLYGMGSMKSYYDGKYSWRPGFKRLQMTDLLLSLGEAIAVLPFPNFSMLKIDEFHELIWRNQDDLFEKIQEKIGFSLEMPLVGRPPVFSFGGIKTNADIVKHAYVAHRIKELGFKPSDAIVEIGGGFGALGLLIHRNGFRNFTIIDLPFIGSIQHFYLASALGSGVVSGFGEKRNVINILPTTGFKEFPDESIDLVVNTDSFAEIERTEALKYLSEIKRTSKYFLSINQEGQSKHPIFDAQHTVVSKLVSEVGGFERVYRFPYWMLEGYVEELFRIKRD